MTFRDFIQHLNGNLGHLGGMNDILTSYVAYITKPDVVMYVFVYNVIFSQT